MSTEPTNTAEDGPVRPSVSNQIAEAEERRRERVRFRNEANRMQVEQERRAKQPRLRAKARAEEAAIVAIESLGVHDPLPDVPEFNHIRSAREQIHKNVVSAFQSMARVFDNDYLDGPQGVTQVAKIGRETLDKYLGEINGLRTSVQRIRGDVEQRVANAMTPPSHLARMVEQARDALRGMPQKDRDELIARARGEEGEIIRYAIAAAPAFLSGVQEGMRMQQRMVLLGLRDPKLLTLEPGLPKALAALDKMEAGLSALINSVVDFESAKAISDLRSA